LSYLVKRDSQNKILMTRAPKELSMHEINSTEFNAVNPWATLDHPHTIVSGL
jgi:hypothetical protein